MVKARVYNHFNGTTTEYRNLHHWVEKQLGKPQECENCGSIDSKRYHWANLSLEYKKSTTDWARLCAKCHRLIDGLNEFKTHCMRGHKLTEGNLYVKPSTGKRACLECKRLYERLEWKNTRQHKEDK